MTLFTDGMIRFMRIRRQFLAIFLFLTTLVRVNAQGDIPLVGPFVTAVPAAQDRIILYDLGGTAERELTFGSGWHNVWGFSPDGCRILYTLTDTNGLGRAYTANIDGSDAQEIIAYDELAADRWGVWEPQWSPSGEKIAFTLLRDGFEGNNERQYHIGWVDAEAAEGSAPQFYSVSGREHTPQWSPDGAWLVYVSYDERVAGADIASTAEPTPEGSQSNQPVSMLNEADLWVVSADGSTKYRLTNFPVGSVSVPRWSPDSQLVGFNYSPSPNNDTLWMISWQQGAIPTQLSYKWGLVLDITWMPDSSAMLAAVRDFRDFRDNRLWWIPLVGNADNDAVQFIENPQVAHTDYPRFSPDGRYLAFRNTYALTVIDLNDKTIVLLDDARPGNTPPIWSPIGFDGEAACDS